MAYIPNILSSLRIVIAPLLLYFAWNGEKKIFLVLLVISLLSDAVDGFIARRFDLSTKLGARLDSIGDMATYLVVPFCAWWLWPEILKKEAPFVITAIAAYLLPLAAGLLKFRNITSYHTYGAKISAVLISIALPFLFFTDFAWIFRIAAVFQAFVALEEILITIHLPELRSNVKSIRNVRKMLSGHPQKDDRSDADKN